MSMVLFDARRLCCVNADWASSHWYRMFSYSDYAPGADYSYSFRVTL